MPCARSALPNTTALLGRATQLVVAQEVDAAQAARACLLPFKYYHSVCLLPFCVSFLLGGVKEVPLPLPFTSEITDVARCFPFSRTIAFRFEAL